MSEMVERAARACYEALGGADPQATRWPDLREKDKDGFRSQVRAAIEAMREPTADIIKAHHVVPDDNDFDQRAADNWRSLIDAALGITE